MVRLDQWGWTFLGFQSAQEGKVVQDWYDNLPRDHKIEIIDLLQYLRNLTSRMWSRPFFDPLEGAGGISEIIVPDIRDQSGVAYYRIYGYFGPEKQEYTLLHATNKKARNDKYGKAIAKRRLEQLNDNQATTHVFDFEERPVVDIKKGHKRES